MEITLLPLSALLAELDTTVDSCALLPQPMGFHDYVFCGQHGRKVDHFFELLCFAVTEAKLAL